MKFWNWDKKPHTTPGRLKRGDIFALEYDKATYCFGRVIEHKRNSYCILEFFDHISDKPEIDEETVLKAGRAIPLVNVNSEHIFNMKLDADIRVIGHQEDFTAPDYDDIGIFHFSANGTVKEDLYGNITIIPDEEKNKYLHFNWTSGQRIKSSLSEFITEKKYSSEGYPSDPEALYQLADTFADARKYDKTIDAILTLPEDKLDRKFLGLLLAAYNNSGRYDEALEALEKYRHLYEGKMRLWYYYATYAQIEKEEYNAAFESIEAGLAECEREREAGTVEMADYNRDVGDFKNLRYRCKSRLEEKEKYKKIGNFVIEKDVLVRYEDDETTTEAVVPDGIKTIAAKAFKNCGTLKSLVIPEGVEKIETYAFDGCVNLESISFPSSLREVFRNNHCLEDTKWYKDHPKGQIVTGTYLYKYTGDEEEVVIDSRVETIGYGAFSNNQTLKKLVIKGNVKRIFASAFTDCNALTDIKIEDGLERISSYAFGNCKALEKITLPGSVNTLSNDVFIGCMSLKEINMPDSLKSLDGGIFYGCSSLEKISLPAQAEGITDSYIGWDHQIGGALFKDCSKLREVTFPKGIKKLLEETFAGCSSLEKINIENPSMMFGKDTFGKKAKYPEALYKTTPELPLHLTDGDIKQYIDLDKVPDDVKAKLFIRRQSKSLLPFWEDNINKGNAKAIGEKLKELQQTKLTAKEKKNADIFFEKYKDLLT